MPWLPEAPAVEIELSAAQMKQACTPDAFEGFNCTAPKPSRQRSIYFDTRKRALWTAGLTLAVAETGEGWVQRITCERAPARAGSTRELEIAVDGKTPDIASISEKSWRHRIEKALDGEPLVAVCELSVDRSSRELTSSSGDVIGLELDTGRVAAGKRKQGFRLARLRLKSGEPAALLAVAACIVSDGKIELSPTAAERGYRLGDTRKQTRILPVKAEASPIDEDMTAAEAMSAVAGSAVAQIQRNWRAVEQTDDPEAVHQLRVGLRRLRSALRIVRHAIDDQGLRTIGEKARDLASSVGRVRDVDVLLSDIVAPLAATAHVAAGLSELRRNLSHERTMLREEVLKTLTSREASLLQIELALLPYRIAHVAAKDDKHLQQPVRRFADKALRKLLDRVCKRGRRIEELTIEERHELRKAMKSLRYGIDFFAPLYPDGKVRHLQEGASDLQDVLGYLNDVALAERLLTYPFAGAARSEAISQAIGAVIGWHAAQAEHAWRSAKTAWKHFHKQAALIE